MRLVNRINSTKNRTTFFIGRNVRDAQNGLTIWNEDKISNPTYIMEAHVFIFISFPLVQRKNRLLNDDF